MDDKVSPSTVKVHCHVMGRHACSFRGPESMLALSGFQFGLPPDTWCVFCCRALRAGPGLDHWQLPSPRPYVGRLQAWSSIPSFPLIHDSLSREYMKESFEINSRDMALGNVMGSTLQCIRRSSVQRPQISGDFLDGLYPVPPTSRGGNFLKHVSTSTQVRDPCHLHGFTFALEISSTPAQTGPTISSPSKRDLVASHGPSSSMHSLFPAISKNPCPFGSKHGC